MKALCIATHPDDETLGCGGTLLRHRDEGDEIHWLIVTAAIGPMFSQTDLMIQKRQIDAAKDAFGFKTTKQLDFPAASIDQIAENTIVGQLHNAIAEVEPDVIYLNHGGDIHSDHRQVFDCTMAALKPFRTGLSIQWIYTMETISETDQAPPAMGRPFYPTTFVDIGKYIERKLEIFSLYDTEQQAYPMPRDSSAIRALARLRGSTLGLEYAEAFMLVREVR